MEPLKHQINNPALYSLAAHDTYFTDDVMLSDEAIIIISEEEYNKALNEAKAELKKVSKVKGQNIFTRALRKIAGFMTLDLENFKGWNGGNAASKFWHGLPHLGKDFIGIPMRFGIWSAISMGVLGAILTKCVTTVFGKSYDAMKQDEIKENKKQQKQFLKNDLKENTEWWVYHNGTEYVVTPTNPESVTLNQSTLELEVGKTAELNATILVPSGITLDWSSSDTSVATVDNGIVTAVGAGTATITATTPTGKTATCTVTVKETIKLEKPDSLDLKAGETVTLTATTNPANKDVTWTSSDESVATVDNGKVTAVGAGTATITATSIKDSKVSSVCQVIVNEKIEDVTLQRFLENKIHIKYKLVE